MSLNGKLKSDFMVGLISAACCKSVLSKIGGYRSMLILKLHLGDIIRNGANTTRYGIIWLPNDEYQFATS
jgi:hypothetical protein